MPPIPHNHPGKIAWNAVLLIAVLVVLLNITYRLAFQSFRADFFYYFVTALFAADIAVNFNTQFKRGYLRVEARGDIARHYLRSWFAVDFLAAFPFELFAMAALGTLADHPVWSALYFGLQLLTLAKLLKVFRLFEELQEALGLIPAVRRLVSFAYFLTMGLHLIALGWILIGASERQRPPFDQYLRALYWTTTTISTIGYGDYTPNHDSNLQVGYTIVIQLFGVGMFSYVIANVSSLVANLDVARVAFQSRLEEVNAYLRSHRIPSDLQSRVRDYYSYLWAKQRGVRQSDLLGEMPRSLSQEILLFLNRDAVTRVELFRDADELFIREAVQLLRPRVFLPDEHIIRQGEFGDSMYFLTSGEVRVVIGGNEVARLGPGSPFGETALLENLHRNASVVSLSFSTGYQMAKHDFDELRSKYPEFDARVRAIVAQRKNIEPTA
jgi:voltage-gated potassium channel